MWIDLFIPNPFDINSDLLISYYVNRIDDARKN